MNKQKTAPESTSFRNGQQMQLDLKASALLTVDYIPQPGTIASVLVVGQSNALTAAELAGVTSMEPRQIRRQIAHERRDGAPILSGQEGFWLAGTVAELRQCARALHQRAAETHRTAAALDAIAKAAEGGAKI